MIDILINAIPSITIAFIVQLLLHEVGHLIGGIVTGWNFIYLQAFHITVIKVLS